MACNRFISSLTRPPNVNRFLCSAKFLCIIIDTRSVVDTRNRRKSFIHLRIVIVWIIGNWIDGRPIFCFHLLGSGTRIWWKSSGKRRIIVLHRRRQGASATNSLPLSHSQRRGWRRTDGLWFSSRFWRHRRYDRRMTAATVGLESWIIVFTKLSTN